MGDGALVEFASVVDAVTCAVAIQTGMAERNDGIAEDRHFVLRIGVHLGDVVVEGDDIYGDGVNVAARLEGLAEPGGICLSQQAFDQVETKLDLPVEDLGPQQVKNIARPVRVYRVVLKGAAAHPPQERKRRGPGLKAVIGPAAVALLIVLGLVFGWWRSWTPDVEPASIKSMAFPLPEKPSIAVLPFANLSEDSEATYIADGLTDNIIDALAKVGSLFVIARNSTFAYKGKQVSLQKVAEDIGVRHVLDGSVQTSGERLRVTARLIDAIEGRQLWSDKYDRDRGALFAIQDDVTLQIVRELQLKLTRGDEAQVFLQSTGNLEAWTMAQRASTLVREQLSPENVSRARLLYKRALETDPGYADALAGLA